MSCAFLLLIFETFQIFETLSPTLFLLLVGGMFILCCTLAANHVPSLEYGVLAALFGFRIIGKEQDDTPFASISNF